MVQQGEKGEISSHEVKIVEFIKAKAGWVGHKDIVTGTGVKYRTVAHHCLRLVHMGLLDLAEVFPCHRYRYSAMAEKRNKAYVLRLATAKEAMAL